MAERDDAKEPDGGGRERIERLVEWSTGDNPPWDRTERAASSEDLRDLIGALWLYAAHLRDCGYDYRDEATCTCGLGPLRARFPDPQALDRK
jgi:hypothetical protein